MFNALDLWLLLEPLEKRQTTFDEFSRSFERQGLRSTTTHYLLIDLPELPGEVSWIQELTMVESVVVRRVGLGEVRWSDGRHLVAVDRVAHEEVLDLVRNLLWRGLARP